MALSLLWAWVQSLVGELRFHKPCSAARKKKEIQLTFKTGACL